MSGSERPEEDEPAQPLVRPREAVSAGAERSGDLLIEICGICDWVVEEGVAFKVVFLGVVARSEEDRQDPDRVRVVGVICAVRGIVDEAERSVIPSSEVRAEAPLGLVAKVGQDDPDSDRNRRSLFSDVGRGVEVVLVDGRPAVEPLRAEGQIQCLADGGLADIVATDEDVFRVNRTRPEAMPRKFSTSSCRISMAASLPSARARPFATRDRRGRIEPYRSAQTQRRPCRGHCRCH